MIPPLQGERSKARRLERQQPVARGSWTGVDPSTISHVYDYRWEKGSDTLLLSLGFDGAIVRNSFAEEHDLKVGSAFAITTPQGRRHRSG